LEENMDTSHETIEQIFQERMIELTRDASRRLRSFERQFTIGA
jgi:hypothetical protein